MSSSKGDLEWVIALLHKGLVRSTIAVIDRACASSSVTSTHIKSGGTVLLTLNSDTWTDTRKAGLAQQEANANGAMRAKPLD